jgi:two-component system chemotaxis sensor kinase CheA
VELDQYLGLFIDESKENLQKLNESLLKLESNPEDLEILNDIFRVAHTLKGMSRTMGFNNVADLTHNMENVLDPLRSGTIKTNENIITVLFQCLDKLEGFIGNIIDGVYEDKDSAITDLVKELKSSIEAGGNAKEEKDAAAAVSFNEYELTLIDNAKDQGFKAIEILVTLTDDCVLNGVRAYMVVKAIENSGELVKTNPSIEELENGNFEKSFTLYLITNEANEKITEVINNISEIKTVQLNDFDVNNSAKREFKEQSISASTDNAGDVQSLNVDAAVKQQLNAKNVQQTIRVNANKMDKLMNLVGELVISRTRIVQYSNEVKSTELSSLVGLMGNITSDIQEIVMKLRMVPIEQVFNRFPRLVRDISKELGKDINLIITGKDTEIDRVVVDEIGDPLVHLIRNSLDHGLETPEDRINAGKSAKGTLELVAFNEGDNILIKVCDDGKGIDPEKIKALAVKKGMITQELAKNMSEKDALDLIFAPGFSTAQVATDLSGRGVGMDVVKSKVSALGGTVGITSKVGVGTTITISLPSNMAILQALLINVGAETYAAPLNYISEVIDVPIEQVKKIQNKEVIVLRGKTLPLVRLHKLLEVPDFVEENDKPLTVVIIKSQGKSSGLIVSELVGQQEVVIKPISKNLCFEDNISGAITLGNGQVALVLNVNALIINM